MLGKKVKCKVTGCTGIAISKIEYMNGCIQYHVQPKELKDWIPVDAKWFDDQQLEIVDAERVVKAKKGTPGGPPPLSTPVFGKSEDD